MHPLIQEKCVSMTRTIAKLYRRRTPPRPPAARCPPLQNRSRVLYKRARGCWERGSRVERVEPFNGYTKPCTYLQDIYLSIAVTSR